MVRLFSHYFPIGALVVVLMDAMFLLIADIAGVMLTGDGLRGSSGDFVPGAIALVMILVTFSGTLGLYGDHSGDDFWLFARRLVIPLVVALPLLHWAFHRLPDGGMSVHGITITLTLAIIGRLAIFFFSRASSTLVTRRILVLGVGADAVHVKQTLERSKSPGLHIAGFYSTVPEPTLTGEIPPSMIMMPERSLLETAKQLNVNEIIIAVRDRRGGNLPLAELLECKLKGVKVIDLATFFENYKSRIRIESLRESWFIFGDGFRQGRARMFVKRVFDIAASGTLLIISAPVMLIAAIAVKLESSGPIIYRQERVGLGGRVFNVLKFRSMRLDAERDGTPQWAQARDPRVTRVGKLMRLTRIDELPQLFTVLKGDMSLVGPRPERPYFVNQIAQKVPFYAARHSVKPGVTGWAQVRHHYGASVDDASDKLEFDLYYVKNHTLFLDLLILFYSVRVVLTAQGAR